MICPGDEYICFLPQVQARHLLEMLRGCRSGIRLRSELTWHLFILLHLIHSVK